MQQQQWQAVCYSGGFNPLGPYCIAVGETIDYLRIQMACSVYGNITIIHTIKQLTFVGGLMLSSGWRVCFFPFPFYSQGLLRLLQ